MMIHQPQLQYVPHVTVMIPPSFTIGLCVPNITWDSVGDFDAWSSLGHDHLDGRVLV